MGRYKIIDIGIYKCYLTVFVGSTKELVRFVEDCDDEDLKDLTDKIKEDAQKGLRHYAASTYWNDETRTPFLYLPNLSTTPKNLEIIVHELSHVVFLILGDVDITVDQYNNEAFAYLIGWLMKEVFNKEGYEEFK